MVMTIRVMSSGKGYEYLLKSVVVGDGDREMSSPLTRYYTESGCPPGTWVGTGLMSLNDGRSPDVGRRRHGDRGTPGPTARRGRPPDHRREARQEVPRAATPARADCSPPCTPRSRLARGGTGRDCAAHP